MSDTEDARSRRVVPKIVPPLFSLAMNSFLMSLERGVELAARHKLRRSLHVQAQMSHVDPTAPAKYYLQTKIPPSLRQLMLDHVLASGRVYNTVDMILVELLFDDKIRRLSVRHVRRWYRSRFLRLLKDHGSGLEELILEEIRMPPGSEITLHRTVPTMTNLTKVSLRFECDDLTLWSLGRSCSTLRYLDVEGSVKVTDIGVQALCLRGATVPSPPVPEPQETGLLATMYSLIDKCLSCSQMNSDSSSVIGLSWWRSSIMRKARRNSCCNTLKVINIASTKVTATHGVNLLQMCCADAKIMVNSKI